VPESPGTQARGSREYKIQEDQSVSGSEERMVLQTN